MTLCVLPLTVIVGTSPLPRPCAASMLLVFVFPVVGRDDMPAVSHSAVRPHWLRGQAQLHPDGSLQGKSRLDRSS